MAQTETGTETETLKLTETGTRPGVSSVSDVLLQCFVFVLHVCLLHTVRRRKKEKLKSLNITTEKKHTLWIDDISRRFFCFLRQEMKRGLMLYYA